MGVLYSVLICFKYLHSRKQRRRVCRSLRSLQKSNCFSSHGLLKLGWSLQLSSSREISFGRLSLKTSPSYTLDDSSENMGLFFGVLLDGTYFSFKFCLSRCYASQGLLLGRSQREEKSSIVGCLIIIILATRAKWLAF